MKNVFLLILAGGIMTTACKKEEMKKETNQQGHSWKTGDWVMTKSNVQINGSLCDEYQNKKTGQVVYEVKENKGTVNYDKSFKEYDDFGHTDCKGKGNTCTVWVIGGERVILVKPGTCPIPY